MYKSDGMDHLVVLAAANMTDSPSQNSIKEKDGFEVEHREAPTEDAQGNLEYTEDVEPALHARTYMALFALFLLNMVQLVALNGRPSGVGSWIPCSADNSLHTSRRT